eukprot:5520535-Amphidinium_carterae.1
MRLRLNSMYKEEHCEDVLHTQTRASPHPLDGARLPRCLWNVLRDLIFIAHTTRARSCQPIPEARMTRVEGNPQQTCQLCFGAFNANLFQVSWKPSDRLASKLPVGATDLGSPPQGLTLAGEQTCMHSHLKAPILH